MSTKPKKETPVTFVQFTHPGHEHGPDPDSRIFKNWNTGGHRRKFLAAPGEYLTPNDRLQTADLVFWGEWEAPSSVVPIQQAGRLPAGKAALQPKWLHRPCLPIPPPAKSAASSGCGPAKQPTGTCGSRGKDSPKHPQNTDPFVFGQCFKYFICKQYRKQKDGKALIGKALIGHATWLSRLERGSVVLFGSTHGKGRAAFFQLDTVFVVDRFLTYNPAKPETLPSDSMLDPEFLRAGFHAAVPVTDCKIPDELELRLYLGATVENPAHGMYSFSPAKIFDSTVPGFPRVQLQDKDLKLPGRTNFFTNNLNGAPKKTVITPDEARSLWTTVLSKCRDHGCVPGVRFHLRPQP